MPPSRSFSKLFEAPNTAARAGRLCTRWGSLNWEQAFLRPFAALLWDDNYEVREMALNVLEQSLPRLSRLQKLDLITSLSRRLYGHRMSEEAKEAVGYA